MKKVKQTKRAVVAVDSEGLYHLFTPLEWAYASIYFNNSFQAEKIYKKAVQLKSEGVQNEKSKTV